ncbi:MBL fold metallo-hydrolase [Streptomyces sp. WAC06614]|uniref:MBL fold metallo-hydrolase n=1 Tax=Streptomyces sp. WAC06614 TaxID=2487416 RepID=UPI000F7677D3|nr:MBL fold metallo-hydrolase [Streptomyces sp. WAC06614]RSS84472.1 MBL fold metallo-hydrolase [Streptomyces sp. WAC06614]
MDNDTIEWGDVTVTRVREFQGPVGRGPHDFVPGSSEDVWAAQEHWLRPEFVDGEPPLARVTLQTWVLRSEGRVILVDTGAGNRKARPGMPWDQQETAFLEDLARAGVRPEDVDLVVNTHLHGDHVGWNTRLDGDAWVPTFPRARYLINRSEFDFWNPANGHVSVLGDGNAGVFEDSVAPVHEAGLVDLWEDGHRIDAHLRLDLAAGHTPGSSVLTLVSGGDRAVFVGDLLHSPVQVLEPDANSCFCEDAAQARATRRRVLGWAADHGGLVVPAHFGSHGALEVVRDAGAFAIKGWAPFAAGAPAAAGAVARVAG